MPDIVSDIVDVYVFRRLNARVQFLLLQRKASVPLGNTWQSFHTHIRSHESTIEAARRAVLELSDLTVSEVYSADYVNEFYDDTRDVVVLAPVLAVNVSKQAPVRLGQELKECAWWDVNQAAARLPFAGQRWAVRHINELMGAGFAESQLYRLQLPAASGEPYRPEQVSEPIRHSKEDEHSLFGFEPESGREVDPAFSDDDPAEAPVDEPDLQQDDIVERAN